MILLAACVALISGAAGLSLWMLTQARQQAPTETLLILPESRPVSDFEMVDHNGGPFTLQQLRGRWSLLFFGFTHCPDVCPSTLYDLQTVNREIADRTGPGPVAHQVLFVSVDPERDTPERMKEYLAFFDPGFIGVTGDLEQLAAFTREMGIAYRIEEHDEGELNYSVDHSASILLTNPDGRLHGVFPAPVDATTLISDLLTVID
jgi:protein SCO1/2